MTVSYILGGSRDLTLAQYNAYAENKRLIEASCIDALIDLDIDSSFHHHEFPDGNADRGTEFHPSL